jgi:hypothetical protein
MTFIPVKFDESRIRVVLTIFLGVHLCDFGGTSELERDKEALLGFRRRKT